jgi:hypothetical protein
MGDINMLALGMSGVIHGRHGHGTYGTSTYGTS